MTAYVLALTEADVRDIAFVGTRYPWSDALRALDAGESQVDDQAAPTRMFWSTSASKKRNLPVTG